MNREFLERYQGICAGIVAAKAERIRDTVSASMPEWPFSKHALAIEGTGEENNQRLKRLKQEKEMIEEAIASIADPADQAVVSLRILSGFSWGEIAGQLGYHYTVEGLKKIYQRAMKKYF